MGASTEGGSTDVKDSFKSTDFSAYWALTKLLAQVLILAPGINWVCLILIIQVAVPL